ncbi:DNA-binding IclR family transcriptional regulator [Conyzicola lurida]|uniref:DNA-binding IclR family transcriptional regulator n=1 Tax=Conyzicola lurida TaxID=1172621 RepID=A0A841AQK1_9MICO|nr:DNA-binding IclR family transcriptional regulator [Conyzicola lurida]
MNALATPTPASTTERVARVLLCFTGDAPWLGVSEISRELGLGKAVVHRILQTLVETAMLVYQPDKRTYGLGPAAIALGRRATANSDVRTAAMPALSWLASVTGETSILCSRVGYRRVYVAQVESAQPIRVTIGVGDSHPLTGGASGNAILAFMPEKDIDLALTVPLLQYTSTTVVDPGEIRERLALVRERGWATTSGERVPLSRSIAVPVFGLDPEPAGALSVAVLASREVGTDEQLAQLVVQAGKQASTALRALQRG